MGWARANILFDRMKGMPEAGSPMEFLFLLVWRKRQEIEFQKSRVVIQALMSQEGVESEHIKKAFEDLREAFFPYEEGQKEERHEKMHQAMLREIQRGPIRVRPMVDLTRSATHTRKLQAGQAIVEKHKDMLRQGQLTRLDRDPIQDARRRKRRTASSIKHDHAIRPVRRS